MKLIRKYPWLFSVILEADTAFRYFSAPWSLHMIAATVA